MYRPCITATTSLLTLSRLLRKIIAMPLTRPDIQRNSAAFDTSIGITERVTAPATFWNGVMRHRY